MISNILSTFILTNHVLFDLNISFSKNSNLNLKVLLIFNI